MTGEEAVKQLDSALAHFEEEAKKLRTGRANASMLDSIKVEVYGQMTPLNHVSSIKVADAQLLVVSPFDPNNLDVIREAIAKDETLGLNPADDGRVVRVPIPAMTTERRQEVVKQLGEKAEETRISFRNTRHDYLNDLKKQQSEGAISEDEMSRLEKAFTSDMQQREQKLEEAIKAKEEELLTL